MTERRLLFHSEARDKLLRGASAMADAVRITLGPKARSVLIGKQWGEPLVCDDGVTIVKEVRLSDPEEQLGAQMMRQAAVRTGDEVGDGTTTATLLAHGIFAEGVRNVVAGASAVDLRRGLERGLQIALDVVKTQSRPVEGPDRMRQVATISAHGDEAVGRLVAEAVEKVGSDGVITVEEAKGTTTELEVVEGMRFDRGYLSPYFVTEPEKMIAVLEEPLVLVFEKRIGASRDLLPLLDAVVRAGRSLLVIAEEVEGEALATLVVNHLRGLLRVCAVKAPGFGDRRKAMLEDIATLTGGRFVAEELGSKLESLAVEELGKAHRVVVTRDTTTIVGGGGAHDAIRARVAQIRQQLADTTSDYDREKLQERLARLVGGVAVLRVGAPSEAEMRKLKEALEDAISATKAAVAEGVVPGAGLVLLRAARAVEAEAERQEGDLRTGLRILQRALEAPTRQIAVNSGLDPGVVVERMRAGEGAMGLDAATGAYVDLLEHGIVDATKAVRVGLEAAVSVAGTLLLTEATLVDLPEKEPAAPDDG
ncbi:chaperonin GroEL [Myxococcota bacterium]|nr:chaperonin GroEL [Myxococcota bacterium]